MNSSQKITLIISTLVSLLAVIIIVLMSISLRHAGYEGAKKKAYLAAELVRNSLTSHMINGTMDQRDTFLNSLNSLQGIKNLWVTRSKTVSDQFGNPSRVSEKPRDGIDLDVLQNGVERVSITETLEDASLRITIPYTASSLDKPNCMSCHDAQEGQVLGAISLTFDIQDDRISGTIVLLYVVGIIAIFLLLILIFIRKKIIPFTRSFDSLTQTLKQVHDGNYSVRAKEGTLKEDKEASIWLNDLIEKLEVVLTRIEKNLTSFVYNRAATISKDKLITAKEIIEDITEIYNYKKTIETDLTKDDIYHRIVQVLKNKLNIETFYIFETNLIKDERIIIYSTEKGKMPPCVTLKNIKNNCRAERTNGIVFSDNFPEICKFAMCKEDFSFICIPFLINEQINIVIHIVCKDKDSLQNAKDKIGIIKKYLEETKPILESKILMEVLKEKNLMDELTKLYNRRYLDEFISNKLPFEIKEGTTFAIMFLDIDYFKMVNDTYGHDVGDKILQQLSDTMKTSISENEFIVRYGGEEFLIIMKNPTEEKALALANKINKDFSKLVFTYNGQSFSKTVSIGYSFFPNDTDQIWKCIKFADISLYAAKDMGRNKVVKFSKELLGEDDRKNY